MRRSWIGNVLAMVVLSVPFATAAFAHPASRIVVDPQGQCFSRTVSVERFGKSTRHDGLTRYSDKLGGHWMALDTEGSLPRADVKLVERITPSGVSRRSSWPTVARPSSSTAMATVLWP